MTSVLWFAYSVSKSRPTPAACSFPHQKSQTSFWERHYSQICMAYCSCLVGNIGNSAAEANCLRRQTSGLLSHTSPWTETETDQLPFGALLPEVLPGNWTCARTIATACIFFWRPASIKFQTKNMRPSHQSEHLTIPNRGVSPSRADGV